MNLAVDLVAIWAAVLALGVFMYVLLDGFDLGVGILYGFAPDAASRSLLMSSIAPVWDGNETWLVLGCVALFAAFPLAFAIIIPAVYFPIAAMLLGLGFRGVSFEFRFKDSAHRGFWDHGFCGGSIVAAFAQGLVLGAFVQGFQVDGRHFTGSSFSFLTPFSIFTGLAVIAGYALLGAGWLIIKTEGALQQWARGMARRIFWAFIVAIVLVSLLTPQMHPRIAARWFSWPDMLYLSPVPIVTFALALWAWRSIKGPSELGTFVATIGLFLLSYVGLLISLWPNIVPHTITLWDAAASPKSQAFLLVGVIFLLPIILIYSAWSYYVFRGKVRGESLY
jgi:cytochrome bd ubiquinol oxidase subunit II